VRDSLSLTDQAIAYGSGRVTNSAVQSMLGLVQRELLAKLLRDIADHNPQAAFDSMEECFAAGASADAVLAEMAKWFHQAAALAALQIESNEDPTGTVSILADKMSAELLQLNYQITVLGRRDLGLAPDERTGLEMTVLRLFAFQPTRAAKPDLVGRVASRASASAASSVPKTANAFTHVATGVSNISEGGPAASLTTEQWPTISRSLAVSGLARQFVQQAQLVRCEDAGRVVNCKFLVSIPALTEAAIIAKAQDALAAYFGKPCRIDAQVGNTESLTAAAEDADAAAKAQSKAEAEIHADPLVQSILQDFGGKIVPGSIRPVKR
jgi:DNA polymerase-3 subunit gamma/tau